MVTGTAVLTAGGAATALLASLEQGLPDVKTFDKLQFAEPTKVYDRAHKRVLATFFAEERRVVSFNQIPQLVLDATTAVEDRTFWENQGYDLQSTVFASLANLTGAADLHCHFGPDPHRERSVDAFEGMTMVHGMPRTDAAHASSPATTRSGFATSLAKRMSATLAP